MEELSPHTTQDKISNPQNNVTFSIGNSEIARSSSRYKSRSYINELESETNVHKKDIEYAETDDKQRSSSSETVNTQMNTDLNKTSGQRLNSNEQLSAENEICNSINGSNDDFEFVHVSQESDTQVIENRNGDNGFTDGKDVDSQPDIPHRTWRSRINLFGARFANLYAFALCFGLSNFFTSMVGQVLQVQLSSLQRQFNIDNSRAGLFDTASRVGFMSTVLFAGHFAKKCHIPLFVGVSGALQGLVLTLPAILQFVDPYKLQVLPPDDPTNSSTSPDSGDSGQYLCHTKNESNWTVPVTNSTSEVKQLGFTLVLVVQVVKGVTDTFHSGFLPTLYMDDNLIDKSKMGIFLGIWQVIAELSGPVGKQINGFLTTVPIDLKKTEMDPSDERFVSAWWLAFLVFGLGTALFSLPIMLFPRQLISTTDQRLALDKAVLTFAGGQTKNSLKESSENEADEDFNDISSRVLRPVLDVNDDSEMTSGEQESLIKDSNIGKEGSLKQLLTDFPKALLRVLRKPIFVLLLLDVVIVSIPSAGISLFRSSYISNEYNVSMSQVATVTAITTAVGQIAGTLISAWISSKVSTRMGYAWIISTSYFLTLAISPLYFVFGCGNEVVYGAEGHFGRQVNLTECDCNGSHELLSCGVDGHTYLSPCYAGCTEVDGKMFTHCSLLNVTSGQTVTPGLCPTTCHDNFIIYCVLHGIQNFFSSLEMVPSRLLILRIVDPEDRGFATSVIMFSLVIASLPSPNLFGEIIDGTCLVWNGKTCSLYDRDKIRYLISGIDLGVHVSVQITCLLLICLLKWEERRARKRTGKE